MMPSKQRRPDLDHCVQILQNLSKDLHTRPPKAIGEIYVAAVGLLYHLKVDQVALLEIRKKAEGKESIVPFPKSYAIPAIAAVVHNQALFRALVSCLSSAPTDLEVDSGRSFPGNSSRKRSLSLSGDTPDGMASKNLKIAHSPQVGKRTFSYGRPQVNVKVLAATILYISFEHLDHWPVPLVKAYAEDCFGPRTWVDEPACQLLVRNLALSHSPECDTDMLDSKNEADALAVAEFFAVKESPQETSSSSPVRQKQRGSLSSVASHNSMVSAPQLGRPRSMSTDSFDTPKPSELKKPKVISAASKMTSVGTTNDDDSDSGEEEEVAVTSTVTKSKKDDDGSSSSSGEEDEEVVVGAAKSFDEESSGIISPNSKNLDQTTLLKPTYPYTQQSFNFEKVRRRYFGANLDHAHLAISASLNSRLDVKSKQNSGLLQTLPLFTAIPGVRTLITANLEKWLQSPALAGLGRSLFSTTVSMMKNVDPPLPADLQAIDNILGMKLKVNQFNAHVENVTAIARRIPTSAVSHHIFNHLLQELALSIDSADASASDHLKMVNAVYNELPSKLAADGIAAALLSLLADKPSSLSEISTNRLIKRLQSIVRSISKELGGAFDSSLLLEALLVNKVSSNSWTIADEENKARLMFQCVTLLVEKSVPSDRKALAQPTQRAESPHENIVSVKGALMKARKILLGWCCNEYAPLCSESLGGKSNGKKSSPEGVVGAGVADYTSILDGLETGKRLPRWLEIMRCVLMLEGPESACLHQFLFPDSESPGGDADWQKQTPRIALCCEHGADVDDEMVWTILKAGNAKSGMSADMALTLLEHVFHGCNKTTKAKLSVRESELLDELYELVEYVPAKPPISVDENGKNSEDAKKSNSEKADSSSHQNGTKAASMARLAFPGMWWRVTSLALIMCGASAERIGMVAWEQYPTLRALMKMVTSDRYRFPTVDCDDASRDEMKKTEQAMRDEEAKITEFLFLPKKAKKKKKDNHSAEVSYGGSRSSRRQQEKREKMLQKQREKEKAEAQAEAHRRKKLLRAAQKSIMLWDPRKGARKPPRESADLIFAVGESFELPKVFQRCTKPDLLLMTIGNTTRGAIERAYDWLIPIISVLPDTISRLPASASCFLLLRAYGTEGEERSQLQNLSSPLLDHVRESLTGKFGEADAVRAFDLLLTDVSSHTADRRRCARRVLHDAIGKDVPGDSGGIFAESNCSWMINILNVEHCESILSDAIGYLTRAASFERGRILRSLVLALERLTKSATEKSLPGTWNFPGTIVQLISDRPAVFAATMGSFPDLRSLSIGLVHDQFKKHVEKASAEEIDPGQEVDILLCMDDKSAESVQAVLPFTLLQCSCVLLSIWLDDDEERGERSEDVDELVRMLMKPQSTEQDDDSKQRNKPVGLVSARFSGSDKSAIPVESWVMLARSRSDFIAKRAALTAPTGFLPRLLLCSGLPRASLLTMIDRLGKLGDKAPDQGKVFNQLLVPSAASEWDIGRLGHRREVSRKLLGRLSAYVRMYKLSTDSSDNQVSFTFLEWLTESCKSADKPRKLKTKKSKGVAHTLLSGLREVGSILAECTKDGMSSAPASGDLLNGDASEMTEFLRNNHENARPDSHQVHGVEEMTKFVATAFERNEVVKVHTWLEERSIETTAFRKRKRNGPNKPVESASSDVIAAVLLKSFSALDRKTEGLGSCILKWVPMLSAASGSPELWSALFAEGQKPGFMWTNLISRCVQSWTPAHVTSCRSWLLSLGKEEGLELANVVFFLMHSMSLASVHHKALFDAPSLRDEDAWMQSERNIMNAAKLALGYLRSVEDVDEIKERVCSRNTLPDSVSLMLLVAQYGKRQLQWLCQAVIEWMEKSDDSFRCVLLALVLRLYACCPQSMNLGVAVLRAVLIEAVEEYAMVWLDWRSPLDDQFHDMIDAIILNGAPPRLVQALAEGSKRHPLLLLRQLDYMSEALEADAIVSTPAQGREKRGVLYGQNLSGPLPAKVDGKLVKVNIKHWGFNYTENLWVSFLDIVSNVPKEVLFGCGLKMGLLDLLGVYLRLMFVQAQLRTSEKNPRLKNKLSEFFGALKGSNNEGWETWLGSSASGLSSLGKTRNVLMSCDFISHQQAIDSVKKVNQASSNGMDANPH